MSALPNDYHIKYNDHDEIEVTYKGKVIGTTFSPMNATAIVTGHIAARAEAAEAQRDELAAQLKTQKELTAWWHSESDKNASERDAAIDACEDYKAQIVAMRNNVAEIERNKFERMAPLDWRTDDETPLGQMLDGIGDEVEP